MQNNAPGPRHVVIPHREQIDESIHFGAPARVLARAESRREAQLYHRLHSRGKLNETVCAENEDVERERAWDECVHVCVCVYERDEVGPE